MPSSSSILARRVSDEDKALGFAFSIAGTHLGLVFVMLV